MRWRGAWKGAALGVPLLLAMMMMVLMVLVGGCLGAREESSGEEVVVGGVVEEVVEVEEEEVEEVEEEVHEEEVPEEVVQEGEEEQEVASQDVVEEVAAEVVVESDEDAAETCAAEDGECTVEGDEEEEEEGEEEGKGEEEEGTGDDADEDEEETDELKSLGEWREKILRLTMEDDTDEEGTPSVPIEEPVVKVKASGDKNRFNYAASAAGAKVLAHSAHLKGASTLLSHDNDKYMMVPCVEKKWFVIQLSEEIVVDTIVIANMEHYSSSVELFSVWAANEFPSEQWHHLGTLKAQKSTAKQVFTLKESTPARYLMFRIKSHYGNEYFCTLTYVRVYGSTMLDNLREEMDLSAREVEDFTATLSERLRRENGEAGEGEVGEDKEAPTGEAEAEAAVGEGVEDVVEVEQAESSVPGVEEAPEEEPPEEPEDDEEPTAEPAEPPVAEDPEPVEEAPEEEQSAQADQVEEPGPAVPPTEEADDNSMVDTAKRLVSTVFDAAKKVVSRSTDEEDEPQVMKQADGETPQPPTELTPDNSSSPSNASTAEHAPPAPPANITAPAPPPAAGNTTAPSNATALYKQANATATPPVNITAPGSATANSTLVANTTALQNDTAQAEEAPLEPLPVEIMAAGADDMPAPRKSTAPNSIFKKLTDRIKSLELDRNVASLYIEELAARVTRRFAALDTRFTKVQSQAEAVETTSEQSAEHLQHVDAELKLLTDDLLLFKALTGEQVRDLQLRLYRAEETNSRLELWVSFLVAYAVLTSFTWLVRRLWACCCCCRARQDDRARDDDKQQGNRSPKLNGHKNGRRRASS